MKKFIGSMIIVRFFISVESLRLNFYRDESFYRSFFIEIKLYIVLFFVEKHNI